MNIKSATAKIGNRITKPKVFILFGGFVFCVLLAVLSIVFSAKTAPPPSVMTYQGKILVGGASATTSLNMYFLLYDAPSGGNLLYTAAGTLGSPTSISVTPNAGLFSVIFGEGGTNTLDPVIFKNNSDMYLEVQVETETLTPRKRITSAPYAFNAKYLDGFAPSQTPTNTAYIPVSDDSGNFDFGGVTTTNLYSSGNITASGSVQSDLYCDANGLNCFDPQAVTAITQINTTTGSYNGNFGSYPAAGGKVGYEAANEICDSEFSGSRLCQAHEIINLIMSQGASIFAGISHGWVANGPPGYVTVSTNDCEGYTSSAATTYGAWWKYSDNVGGGSGKMISCNSAMPISCCQ
jgi:hypothetical protein